LHLEADYFRIFPRLRMHGALRQRSPHAIMTRRNNLTVWKDLY